MLSLIPKKAYLIGIVILVATTGGYLMTQYLKTIGKQEEQIKNLQEDQEIRRKVDAAIRNAPNDRDGSIGVLDEFLGSRGNQ